MTHISEHLTDIVFLNYLFEGVICTVLLLTLIWWWKWSGKASAVYKCITFLVGADMCAIWVHLYVRHYIWSDTEYYALLKDSILWTYRVTPRVFAFGIFLVIMLHRIFSSLRKRRTCLKEIANGKTNSRCCVLVVEDNKSIHLAYTMNFKDSGFECICVTNGEEALKLIKNGYSADVIFIDLVLPGIDGLTLSKKIKSMRGGLIVTIAATANVPVEFSVSDCRKAGFDHVLIKPFKVSDMVALAAEAFCEVREWRKIDKIE